MSLYNHNCNNNNKSNKRTCDDETFNKLQNEEKGLTITNIPLVSKIEAVDIESDIKKQINEDEKPMEKAKRSSYLFSNYQKAKKFLLQKSYFNFKINLTGNKNSNIHVFEDLKFYLKDLRNHFQFLVETKPLSASIKYHNDLSIEEKLYVLSSKYLECLNKCIDLYNDILSNAHKYDYDSKCQGNGYRSLGQLIEKCCLGTLVTMKQIYSQKSFFLFYTKYTLFTSELKDLEAWYNLIEKLEIILMIAAEMQGLSSTTDSLFINDEFLSLESQENIFLLQTTYQKDFFGRTCCFQFSDSLKIPLTTFTVAMASYNDFLSANDSGKIKKTAKTISSGPLYFMNPELRGLKIANIMKTSNVEFCKFFSRLSDNKIFHVNIKHLLHQLLTIIFYFHF
jgi:hypothetical protein